MNTFAKVQADINGWKAEGLTKPEVVVKAAEDTLGWPYVWGGAGQKCTSANRKSYADRGTCPSAEAALIRKQCQILNGSRGSCDGCKFYPGGSTLFFDCRGFTRWLLAQVGITLNGAGATSQWNTSANWTEKGEIKDMPDDIVCCVFMRSGNTMEHTGMCIGHGEIIHCSGTVKRGKITDRGWTHYAIPKGLEGKAPAPSPTPDPGPVVRSTIRYGSSGACVKECQEDLLKLGYNIGSSGADGKFGRMTEAAVKAFQSNAGLKADGIVGSATWAALDKAVADGTTTGQTPEKKTLYTVTIRHLEKEAADALKKQYADAEVTEEKG